ncbi:MAG: ABC transporter permease [Gammaproteobacteria bacterium]|nr:ABC transporter permease [Gammaproteobacteria bacterium]MCY4218231.1 ABC transporter permease [Gammaproteobacteria bacterium]MCY4273804.1 ABC transporter permease [Gammaproteobacteria bacterium]
MTKMVLRRIAIGVATLVVVSVIVFVMTSILPGDVAQIILGQSATPETLAALRIELGMDKPGYIRYFQWLGNMATGDLGISKAGGATIESLISGRLGNTMVMSGLVAVISIPISIVLGLWAAMHPGALLDRAVTFGTLSLISVPEFFIATILVLILAVELHWLPSTAYLTGDETFAELLKALAMPLITLVIVVSAQMIRMTRAGILNVMSSPYIEMAILKGVPRRRIILRHAFFNAIGPIVNVIALNLAYLVSGVVVVETIFSYPGLAKLMIDGVQTRDLPLVQACAMIFCGAYVILILMADIASIMSNPRLRNPK